MKSALQVSVSAWLILVPTLPTATAATHPLPQLHIQATDSSRAALTWPATASDFVLEETRHLSALNRWSPATQKPTVDGETCTVDLASAAQTRFFRLRYVPEALRGAHPAISCALLASDGTNAAVGRPFALELRASFNALLAAAAVRLTATGSAQALLTGRSADPGQANGLMFLSATSQQPFESGLPVSLGGNGSPEVLLGTGPWPFDGLQPGEEVLLERWELTPTTTGELTVALAGVDATSTRWARDGVRFEWVGLDPWRAAVTVHVRDGAGTVRPTTTANRSPAGEPPATRPAVRPGSSRSRVRLASAVTPNADGQGGVDLADLVYVRARLGLDPALPQNASADVDQDGTIDLLDLMAVRNRFTPPGGSGERPAPRLSEVAPHPAPGEAPWVELRYPQPVEPCFDALELRNGAQDVLLSSSPDSISIWVSYIVIVFDGEKPLEYVGDPGAPTAVRVHLPQPATVLNPTNDQCLLYLQGELIDSVAWGPQPERNAALNTSLFPVPLGGSIGRDGLERNRWVRFAQPTPGADNGLPTPLACLPFDGAGVLAGENTRFAWVDPRSSPVAYDLEVDDLEDFQTPLIHTTCYEPSYTPASGFVAGIYYWRLRARAGDLEGAWSPASRFEVLDLMPPQKPGRAVPQGASTPSGSGMVYGLFYREYEFAAPHKDTSMICLECDQDTGDHAWDRAHTRYGICQHEIGHAGAAIAFEMGEYYRNLRWPPLFQDEINHELFSPSSEEPEGQLGHGRQVDLGKALNVALAPKLVLPYYFNPHQDSGTWDNIMATLDRQIPFVGQFTLKTGVSIGPVIVVGYYDSPLDPKSRRLVALSPFSGNSKWVFSINDLAATVPTVYVPADPPSTGSLPDGGAPEVHTDADRDGLCDFDEALRFPTEQTKPDSDGDGIPDKTEIWSYRFGRGWAPRAADLDGDGLRAEVDPDSDDDGCPDGAEDRNHNGTLFDVSVIQVEGGYVGIKGKDSDETDPFSLDEFKLTLTAGRTPLCFSECSRLEVKVTDKEDRTVKNAQVRFKLEPFIASFEASGGAPVTTAFENTDENGKASTDICAQETEGTVTVEASYKPCPDGKESKTDLKIQILPYDWIFAVQEKAVLTGAVITNDFGINAGSGATEGTWQRSYWKDAGFQKVSGTFFHPKTPTPEQYIHTIAIPYAPSAVLRIDGTNVNGLTWTRSSTNDRPSRWEVVVSTSAWTQKPFPRYLQVATAGGPGRRTPLLWWSDVGTMNQHRRAMRVGNEYATLVSIDWTKRDNDFFFGDGDEYGQDPVCWDTPHPDPNGHTAVSFIPVNGIPGYAIGAREQSGWPFDWGFDPWDKTGGVYSQIFNAYCKVYIVWTPPAPWTVSRVGRDYDIKADLQGAGPPEPPPFLMGIRFKRDYLGNELKELEQRQLDPPRYEIRMLTEE